MTVTGQKGKQEKKLATSGLESLIERFLTTMFVQKTEKISMKIAQDR